MLNFSFQDWNERVSANLVFQNKLVELEQAFISRAMSKPFSDKKTNHKNLLDKLHKNTELNAKYSELQGRIADQASEHPLTRHLSNLELATLLLLEHQDMVDAFLHFQENLNHATAAQFNQEVVKLREMIADQIKNSHSILLHHGHSKNPSVIFHLLLSLLYINFHNFQKNQYIDDAYFNFINNIQANAVAISRIHLRGEPTIKSASLLVLQKNSIIKLLKDQHDAHWSKVLTYVQGREMIGYLPTAYIKIIQ